MCRWISTGARQNHGLEGLTLAPSGTSLWAGMEAPGYNDGEPPTDEHGALTRVTRFDVDTGTATAQYAYPLDSVSAGTGGDNGLSDLVALDDENFLVVERGFGTHAVARIYRASIAGADNVLGRPSLNGPAPKTMTKTLVVDLSKLSETGHLDNVEGITLGPKRPRAASVVLSRRQLQPAAGDAVLRARWTRSAVAADGDRRRLLGDLGELGLLDVDTDQMPPSGEKHTRAQQHRCGADPERQVHADLLAEHTGQPRGERGAREPHEAVGRRGHAAFDGRRLHDGLGDQRVVDSDEQTRHDHARRQHGLVVGAHGHYRQRRRHRQQIDHQRRHGAEPVLQPRRDHHGGERQRQPPAEEDQPDLMGAHVEREWCERQEREEAEVVQQRGDCDAEQAAVPQAAERVGQRGSAFGAGWDGRERW